MGESMASLVISAHQAPPLLAEAFFLQMFKFLYNDVCHLSAACDLFGEMGEGSRV